MAYIPLSDSASAPASLGHWTLKTTFFYLAMAAIAIMVGVPAAVAIMLGAS